MIGIIFMFASEMVEVRIEENHIQFRTGVNPSFVTIDALQLSKAGVIKEFPDLADAPDWRMQAIARFKDKISFMKTEEDKVAYVIEDLSKHGYIPKYIQKGGHRVKRIEDGKWRSSL